MCMCLNGSNLGRKRRDRVCGTTCCTHRYRYRHRHRDCVLSRRPARALATWGARRASYTLSAKSPLVQMDSISACDKWQWCICT